MNVRRLKKSYRAGTEHAVTVTGEGAEEQVHRILEETADSSVAVGLYLLSRVILTAKPRNISGFASC
jgi:hypothetical protein